MILMENSNNIKLTYETLFEILRIEKNRGELQELDKNFIDDLKTYLSTKNEIITKENSQSTLFGEAEKLKTLNELSNIKRIVKELYQKRESKIIQLVLNKSRTNSSTINSENLLPEETPLYDSLLEILNNHRKNILHNIINSNNENTNIKTKEIPKHTEIPKSNEIIENNENFKKLIRFTTEVPEFVGKELEPYGPFKPNDIANLPYEIAQILIEKENAIEVKTE